MPQPNATARSIRIGKADKQCSNDGSRDICDTALCGERFVRMNGALLSLLATLPEIIGKADLS